MLFFLAIAVLSLVLNIVNFTTNQIIISSLYLVRVLLYVSMYFVFVDLGFKYKQIVPKFMFLASLVFIVIGYFQYFFFSNLKEFYYLGWDMHLNRLFSSFLDPNFAGAFLVLILMFVFILKDSIFSKEYKYLIYVFLVFNFIAIFLTFSRGAILMLLVCVITYSFITRNWKLTLGVVASLFIIFLILIPKFNLESTNLLRTASINARIDSSKYALSIWEKKPMGVGFNTYRYARGKYGNEVNKSYLISHAGAGIDNSFIFVLVTTGVIGLVTYLYLFFRIFKLGFKNAITNKYALVLVVSIVGISFNALTVNSLFYSFILLWIFVLVGFTESTLRE